MSQSNTNPPGDPPLPKTVFLTPGSDVPPQAVPAAPTPAVEPFPVAGPVAPAMPQPGYRAAIPRQANGAGHDAMHPALPREAALGATKPRAQPIEAQTPKPAAAAAPQAAPPAPSAAVPSVNPSSSLGAKPVRRRTFEDDVEQDFGPAPQTAAGFVPAVNAAQAAPAPTAIAPTSLNGHAPQSPELAPWAQQTPHTPRHGSTGFTHFADPSPRTGVAQGVAISWHGNPWSLLGLGALNGLLSMLTLGVYRFWGITEVRKRIWSFIRLEGEPLAYTGTGGELFKGFLIVFFAVLMPLFFGPLLLALYLGDRSTVGIAIQFASYAAIFYLTGVAIYRGWGYRLARTNWRGIRGSLLEGSWKYGWSYFWTGLIIGLLLLMGYALAIGVAVLLRPSSPLSIAAIVLVGLVLAVIPALILVPWRSTKLNRELTNDMRFGSRPFSFTGVAKPLYASFMARWIGVLLLALVTIALVLWLLGPTVLSQLPGMPGGTRRPSQRPGPMGDLSLWRVFAIFGVLLAAWFIYSIITAWYRAVEANYFASQTHYENATFHLDIKGRGLVWVAITNWLIQAGGFLIMAIGAIILIATTSGGANPQISTGGAIFAGLFYILGYFALVAVRPVIQARTLKYYVDHLRLIGPIDAGAIAQNEAALSKTGEGLAGAFDVSF
ncbi:MAG: hypothetical protein RL291_1223 [Pseudomonadota bacterium]